MQYQLRLSGEHYKKIQRHLFPGDGKEAVAVILCGRHESDELSILLTHKLVLIPYEECERSDISITWKTAGIIDILDEAEKKNMAILKIHSHPNGYATFSHIDDKSDIELFSSVFGWVPGDGIHASAVMLPNGRIFGRVFQPNLNYNELDKITVVGDEIKVWGKNSSLIYENEFSIRTRQAFGEGTYTMLKHMKIGVVGCSGTGSPTIEQLTRLGVGHLVLVDPDIIEEKNLNRILNTTLEDAKQKKYKCDLLKDSIERMGLGTVVTSYCENLYESNLVLKKLISCDIIFGCVDSVDGRHLLSQLSNFYLIPYFDMGVKLKADGKGGIQSIVGSINYIQPGLSTLLSRGLYTPKDLFEAGLRRQDPEEYDKRVKQKYIDGVEVDRPAVISVNMLISSHAVIEFLNRIHNFKDESADYYARVMIDYCDSTVECKSENMFKVDPSSAKWAGRGDYSPFLRMIELENEIAKVA